MKRLIGALILLGGSLSAPQALADWFNGTDGLYLGSAINVTKVTDQLNRRLGGPNDPGGIFISEPAFHTNLFLRGGWQIASFLAIEAQYGIALETDRVDNADNTQVMDQDSLYGIYLKPTLPLGESISIYGTAGFSDFSYTISRPNDPDPNTNASRKFSDSGFAWGGGIQFNLTGASRLSLEYTQHYDEDEGQVFGIGVNAIMFFGAEEEDDYY